MHVRPSLYYNDASAAGTIATPSYSEMYYNYEAFNWVSSYSHNFAVDSKILDIDIV